MATTANGLEEPSDDGTIAVALSYKLYCSIPSVAVKIYKIIDYFNENFLEGRIRLKAGERLARCLASSAYEIQKRMRKVYEPNRHKLLLKKKVLIVYREEYEETEMTHPLDERIDPQKEIQLIRLRLKPDALPTPQPTENLDRTKTGNEISIKTEIEDCDVVTSAPSGGGVYGTYENPRQQQQLEEDVAAPHEYKQRHNKYFSLYPNGNSKRRKTIVSLGQKRYQNKNRAQTVSVEKPQEWSNNSVTNKTMDACTEFAHQVALKLRTILSGDARATAEQAIGKEHCDGQMGNYGDDPPEPEEESSEQYEGINGTSGQPPMIPIIVVKTEILNYEEF